MLLELLKETRRKGVDGPQDVPVDETGARRSGDGTLVDPTVVGVDHHNEVTVSDLVSEPLSVSLVPVEGLEEVVNNILLILVELLPLHGGVVSGPEDSKSLGDETCFARLARVGREVHSVHLEVVVLSINSMLRQGMEMELHSGETLRAAPLVANESGVGGLHVLTVLVDSNLGGVAIPDNLDVILLVGVHLLEVVILGIVGGPSISLQIDGGLVGASAVVAINPSKVGPVSSVCLVVPTCSVGRGSEERECADERELHLYIFVWEIRL